MRNPIIQLLKGPDTEYKNLLIQDYNSPILNTQCRDKNSFLQIHVRALNAKEQNRLLKKEHHRQSIKKKDKCLHFTFPITYPCLSNQSSASQNHSSSLLKIQSTNTSIEKHLCQLCGSILSNGICSCIVKYLLKLNNTNEDHILEEFNEIIPNLTSNNIIT